MSDQPRIVESTINWSGGGKVAIVDYGKISSEYHGSLTRKYAVPEDWTDDQVADFEIQQVAILQEQLAPVLQEEFDKRYDIREWEDERGAALRE